MSAELIVACCATFIGGWLLRVISNQFDHRGRLIERHRGFEGTLRTNEKNIRKFLDEVDYEFIHVRMWLNAVKPSDWRQLMIKHEMLDREGRIYGPRGYNGPPAEVADEIIEWFIGTSPFSENYNSSSPIHVRLEVRGRVGGRKRRLPSTQPVPQLPDLQREIDERVEAALEVERESRKIK